MNKRFAPTLIVILGIVFLAVQTGVILFALRLEGLGWFWTGLIMLVPLLLMIAFVSVYLERMNEIEDEEKDNLDKY
ncbi:MAG: hypothetical protein R2751_15200 [Bacteroidales bacterium]